MVFSIQSYIPWGKCPRIFPRELLRAPLQASPWNKFVQLDYSRLNGFSCGGFRALANRFRSLSTTQRAELEKAATATRYDAKVGTKRRRIRLGATAQLHRKMFNNDVMKGGCRSWSGIARCVSCTSASLRLRSRSWPLKPQVQKLSHVHSAGPETFCVSAICRKRDAKFAAPGSFGRGREGHGSQVEKNLGRG